MFFEKNQKSIDYKKLFWYTWIVKMIGVKSMTEVEEKLDLVVVKRNGKKVDFDATKIALAIKKGFDSIKTKIKLK